MYKYTFPMIVYTLNMQKHDIVDILYHALHSTGFQIWPLPMLFLNSLRNNIFWKNICKGFCSCKSQRNAKFDILHWQKWVPDVSPLWNIKFHVSLTFIAAKVFVNILSRKYYFTNNLEITLAGAKFWTLCCVMHFWSKQYQMDQYS